MRFFILISFLLLVFYLPAKAQNKANVVVAVSDCRISQSETAHTMVQHLSFYKLPEDSLVLKIYPMLYGSGTVMLDSLAVGDYKLKYENYYGQNIETIVAVKAKETNRFWICPDKLQYYPQSTLNKLKEGDSIVVSFISEGCFHFEQFKLTITREVNDLKAALYHFPVYAFGEIDSTRKPEWKFLKAIRLGEKDIIAFNRFENELNYVSGDGGCTTTDYYIITSNYLQVNKEDGKCKWDGFYYLRKSLFGLEK